MIDDLNVTPQRYIEVYRKIADRLWRYLDSTSPENRQATLRAVWGSPSSHMPYGALFTWAQWGQKEPRVSPHQRGDEDGPMWTGIQGDPPDGCGCLTQVSGSSGSLFMDNFVAWGPGGADFALTRAIRHDTRIPDLPSLIDAQGNIEETAFLAAMEPFIQWQGYLDWKDALWRENPVDFRGEDQGR